MKKLYLSLFALVLVLSNSSCKKYLDQVPDDRLTFDEAFTTRATVDQLLANVYSVLPDEASQRFAPSSNAGVWTGASDEADYTLAFVPANSLNQGAWDATTSFVESYWQSYYKGIQSASNFIANVDKCKDCNLNEDRITRYKNEARALRAIYYFYLVRQYGPVVILGNDPTAADATLSSISKPRSTFDECINFIVSELDAATAGLPAVPNSTDAYGRINKAVAQAYKVKALLTAASPQFNGNADFASLKNTDGTQLISQAYDVSKWKKAADAAKAFITTFPTFSLYRKNDDNGAYSAYLSCRDVMLTDWNSEIILAMGSAGVTNYFYDITPDHANAPSSSKGGSFCSATQNIVDAFFTANGRSIDDPLSNYNSSGVSNFQSPYDNQTRSVSNMYVNREPRFYVDITYNNSRWLDFEDNIVTSFEYNGNAGKAGIGNTDYSSTGYTIRKNMPLGSRENGGKTFVMIRLAEIYLDYAEALNESDPGNPDVLLYLNKIRDRAGIPLYGGEISVPSSQADMRTAIWKERRVELAFENARYFDVRRWKIAESTETSVNGLDIYKNANNGFYNVIRTESRVFEKKHYLFPIPNGDVQKVPLIVQNPGW
ncbi:RagB/SusD family nutrient uptake outer membrane protein [Pedobacter sp. L105]|uniref:RagB/SusD family nutrient uptake outer membrane protein n=1 Tax=Pedobacter sp. L105 TaxID=1641871 RepID=UPI00131DC185|nr:RagB/SusD family nutrient uptake outer membrane protein [Pedobacter sp. L105]